MLAGPTRRDLTARGHEPRLAAPGVLRRLTPAGAAACGDGNDHRSFLPGPGQSRCYRV